LSIGLWLDFSTRAYYKHQRRDKKSLLGEFDLGVDTCTPFDMATNKEETTGLKGVHKTFDVGYDDLLMVSSKR
jgi:hypothetical protein